MLIGIFFILLLLVLPVNPHTAISTNGSLPIKISQDETGETWQLPDGKYIYKTGGEAPPRIFDDGIKVNGTLIESSSINVDLTGSGNSEISYIQDDKIISKENWFIYENDVKIPWSKTTDGSILLTDIPRSETVGGYTVLDYEKEASQNKILDNSFGQMVINYKIHEGKPLKHTLDFTTNQKGVFQVCQEYSDLVYDSIKTMDVDYKNSKVIDTFLEPVKPKDVSKTITQDQITVEKDPQLELPEMVVFEKDDKIVLGEITSGAKQDFKSFEYDSDNNTAKFCYGDFNLNSGESFTIDPDTYSSASPTYYTYIYDNGGSGTVCDTTSLVNNAGIGSIVVGLERDVNLQECYRATIEWNITSITDGSAITNTVFKYDISSVSLPRATDITPMSSQPSTGSTLNNFNDIGDGTTYATISSPSAGDNQSIDLGTSADTDVQSHLGVNWFAIGIKTQNETIDSSNHLINAFDVSTGTPAPTLEITYSVPSTVIIKTNYFNGTALTSGTVIQSNSSSSRTISINSTGYAGTFTGLSGNQNLTTKDFDNIITNKTRNVSPTGSTLTVNTSIYTISCPQNGAGNDIEIKINNTRWHTITTQSTPTCSSGGNMNVTWSATFSKDGNPTNLNNLTSIMVAKILNNTAFGKSPYGFRENGTLIQTSYSSPKITSSSFQIGTGLQTRLINFNLALDPRPDRVTGLSASSSSTSVIDLSWSAPISGIASVTGYRIFSSSDGINFSTLVSNTGTTQTTYSNSGLSASTTRYYIIAGISQYGVGGNSTASSATTQSSSGGGSSGGGSGGGGVPNTINTSLTTLSLTAKTLLLRSGASGTSSISFKWDSGSDFIVTSIITGTSPIALSFNTPPLTLLGSRASQSTGDLMFNVLMPKVTTESKFTIPVTISGTLDGQTVTKTVDVIVEKIGNSDISLIIISLVAVFVVSVFAYRHYHKNHRKSRKNGDLLNEIINTDLSSIKPRKNGTLLRNLKKLDF